MTLWTRLAKFAYFETDRLYLRPFSFEDGESFYEIVSNPENLPFIFPALEDRNIAFSTMVEKFMRSPLGNWALIDKVSGRMIGALCFEKIDERQLSAELSYFLKKDYWGQGLMTEAVKNLVFLTFYEIGLNELIIITHEENVASQMVAKKTGFVQVEQYRGSDRYSHKMRNYLKFSLKRADFRLEM
ncbi:TPA: GNAT family N-acetyltransferase [Streptococcus suis]|nr:GNAT family N-acetyltransferase [Streptococcus suis]HEM6007218.1 GNAT family N-acetyltransferase [Streptococcus suis]HEM6009267.1 GNAT family N-acetyltransferase [Streptococcus suis]HEM6014713.1 GNAT family N-acetyltransferase [Streptococcus suis]HEM6029026.1 GNAT family N-acetyltransferase [Streptococcus suis]